MLAAQINLDMQTFSFQDAVRQKLVFDIHSASFNSLRAWSRKCGIANQEAYGESRQDLQAFLRQRLQEVISTFSEEDWCTLGSLADVVEIVKGSMISCCPNCASLCGVNALANLSPSTRSRTGCCKF